MKEVTLQELLEAGCHFGHKSERWHPKASKFIYVEKDGIHIIDLAKTKAGLEEAAGFVRDLVAGGSEILFVGTKRQAKGIVKTEGVRAEAPYITERWIGGFLTNWDGIHKNIQKIIRMQEEEATGKWKKFPKHEQMKMGRYLRRLNVFYGGVLKLDVPPQALFIIDVKKEIAAVREAVRIGVPVVAIVDTNSDPTGIEHVIPANDDAVGSVTLITQTIANAYIEGKAEALKNSVDAKAAADKAAEKAKKEAVKTTDVNEEIKKEEKRVAEEITATLTVEAKPRPKADQPLVKKAVKKPRVAKTAPAKAVAEKKETV
ncbi:MAG: 30S ribosomal protein S2 [Microgenomates group bacterium]